MRVLQLVYSLPVGGLESMVLNLTAGLRQAGSACQVGCLNSLGRPKSEAPEVVWCGAAGRARFVSLPVLASLCTHIHREAIEVIHTHNPKALHYGVLASLCMLRPLVHTVHGVGATGHYDSALHVALTRFLLARTRFTVGVSAAVVSKIEKIYKVPPTRTKLIINGVNVKAICSPRRSVRKELGLPGEALIIGSVGRLCPEKNYPLLIDAVSRLVARVPNVHLVLVGAGSSEAHIRERIAEQGLANRVTMPGVRSDVPRWLAAMDVFCLSSDTEGMPISLLEAGACGLPAVVTDVGGNAEVVNDGVTGLVVPAGGAHALQAALFRLLANPTERCAFGAAAAERIARHFSMTAMVQAYESLYRQVAR
jgi:glycosyltransferase involved in cell wall biosynthesis